MQNSEDPVWGIAKPWLEALATTDDAKVALSRILDSKDVREKFFTSGADFVAGVTLIERAVKMVNAPVDRAQVTASDLRNEALADANALRAMKDRWRPLADELTALATRLEAMADSVNKLPQFRRLRKPTGSSQDAGQVREQRAMAVDMHGLAMRVANRPMHEFIAALIREALNAPQIDANTVKQWAEAETRRLAMGR